MYFLEGDSLGPSPLGHLKDRLSRHYNVTCSTRLDDGTVLFDKMKDIEKSMSNFLNLNHNGSKLLSQAMLPIEIFMLLVLRLTDRWNFLTINKAFIKLKVKKKMFLHFSNIRI